MFQQNFQCYAKYSIFIFSRQGAFLCRPKGTASSCPDYCETLSCYDLRNGYSTTEKRDLCENEWPQCMALNFEDVNDCLMQVYGLITEGNLEVYFNDMGTNSAYAENHGIWNKDGKITQVY